MTKAELVSKIAAQTGYDKTTILNIVESAMSNVKKSVAGGDNVYLRGFAKFYGRNVLRSRFNVGCVPFDRRKCSWTVRR